MRNAGERIRRSWDENADAWIAAVRGARLESRHLATDAAMVDTIMALSPRRVLDVGCGEGWLCRRLEVRGIHAVGVDASPALVDAARDLGGSFHHLYYEDLARDPLRLRSAGSGGHPGHTDPASGPRRRRRGRLAGGGLRTAG